jgi:hypothetical protein
VTAVIARSAALGAALVFAWGVADRIWMRLISTDPQFSWSGTSSGLEGVQVLPGAQERPLHQILRLVVRAEHPAAVHPRPL